MTCIKCGSFKQYFDKFNKENGKIMGMCKLYGIVRYYTETCQFIDLTECEKCRIEYNKSSFTYNQDEDIDQFLQNEIETQNEE